MNKVIGLLLIGFTVTAIAKPQNVTESEIALLPRYCIDTEYFEGGPKYSNRMSPRAPYWVSIMGEGFWWMHHYCSGLIFFNRAQSSRLRGEHKRYAYIDARLEFAFTINKLEKNFLLLPEIYTKLGEAESRLSNISAASIAFSTARDIKPDYWPAYSKWADILIINNQKVEAKRIVAEGLKHSPNSKVLREQYRTLGGNPSEIQPTTNPAPAIESPEPESTVSPEQELKQN